MKSDKLPPVMSLGSGLNEEMKIKPGVWILKEYELTRPLQPAAYLCSVLQA